MALLNFGLVLKGDDDFLMGKGTSRFLLERMISVNLDAWLDSLKAANELSWDAARSCSESIFWGEVT